MIGRRHAAGRPPAAAFGRLILTEAKLAWRTPVGLIYGLAFPVILLVIFASIPSFRRTQASLGGMTLLSVYMPILSVFVIAILALVGLTVPLATYRQLGVLRRLSTTPLPRSWVLGAQLVVNLAFAVAGLVLLIAISIGAFGAQAPAQVPGFVLTLILTIAAMFAMGLWIAAIARTAQAAGVIGTILFYPMIFFAGLWVPRQSMPSVLRHISDYTPLGAAVQAMQSTLQNQFPGYRPLVVLVAYAALLAYAAVRYFKWE